MRVDLLLSPIGAIKGELPLFFMSGMKVYFYIYRTPTVGEDFVVSG